MARLVLDKRRGGIRELAEEIYHSAAADIIANRSPQQQEADLREASVAAIRAAGYFVEELDSFFFPEPPPIEST